MLSIQGIKEQQSFVNSHSRERSKASESETFQKRILIVDDDFDNTLVFKIGIEQNDATIKVDTYNNPLEALLDFKPNYYDLLLIDINMPLMTGFKLCKEILKLDMNVKVCFMSAGEINQQAFREAGPTKNICCFIKKPVTICDLVRRLKVELE